MPSVRCAQLARDICVSGLDVPARELPGFSGKIVDSPGSTVYWRRLAENETDDPFAPIAPNEDNADEPHEWVVLYRLLSTDECINHGLGRDVVLILRIVANAELAHYVMRQLL